MKKLFNILLISSFIASAHTALAMHRLAPTVKRHPIIRQLQRHKWWIAGAVALGAAAYFLKKDDKKSQKPELPPKKWRITDEPYVQEALRKLEQQKQQQLSSSLSASPAQVAPAPKADTPRPQLESLIIVVNLDWDSQNQMQKRLNEATHQLETNGDDAQLLPLLDEIVNNELDTHYNVAIQKKLWCMAIEKGKQVLIEKLLNNFPQHRIAYKEAIEIAQKHKQADIEQLFTQLEKDDSEEDGLLKLQISAADKESETSGVIKSPDGQVLYRSSEKDSPFQIARRAYIEQVKKHESENSDAHAPTTPKKKPDLTLSIQAHRDMLAFSKTSWHHDHQPWQLRKCNNIRLGSPLMSTTPGSDDFTPVEPTPDQS